MMIGHSLPRSLTGPAVGEAPMGIHTGWLGSVALDMQDSSIVAGRWIVRGLHKNLAESQVWRSITASGTERDHHASPCARC